MTLDDTEARARVERVGALLQQAEALADPAARSLALELAQTCMELYGEGLARVLRHAGDTGADALEQTLAGDELIGHLLVLHGLHPLDAPARVRRALDAIEPALQAQGASVELLSADGEHAKLRLHTRGGCGSSGAALRATVEGAVADAAPELDHVDLDEAGPEPALIPADSLFRPPAGAARGPAAQGERP